MDGSNPSQDPATVTPERPSITIRFAGPGSAEVASVEAPGIGLGQLYLAAWLLDAIARENRQGELTKAALGGGLTPGMQNIVRDIMAGRPVGPGPHGRRD